MEWAIIQRMLIDSPKSSDNKIDEGKAEIDFTEESVDDLEKLLRKYE